MSFCYMYCIYTFVISEKVVILTIQLDNTTLLGYKCNLIFHCPFEKVAGFVWMAGRS